MGALAMFAASKVKRQELEAKRQELMVFDWDKAARIIRGRKPVYVEAGLREDWAGTCGAIYEKGQIVTSEYTHLSSIWAAPEIRVDGEAIPCYKMESEVPNWGCDTKWPESARAILNNIEVDYEVTDYEVIE